MAFCHHPPQIICHLLVRRPRVIQVNCHASRVGANRKLFHHILWRGSTVTAMLVRISTAISTERASAGCRPLKPEHRSSREFTMHDQGTTGRAGEPAPGLSGHKVAVLSASVLRAARTGYRESREGFAARAGVDLHVVEGVEAGSRPVWDLPYATFTAMGDAVSVLNPSLRTVFEVAAACDLMLTCVMR